VAASRSFEVQGQVSRGFEAAREAFAENFVRRQELGGACCVFHRGEKVVDLWGGIRNKQTAEPWERGTMVVIHSATKGLAAMTLAIAHSRGWLDYEERVCTYWPEFAQQEKERVTVRQLLAHQAGLFAFNEPVDRNTVADLDRLAASPLADDLYIRLPETIPNSRLATLAPPGLIKMLWGFPPRLSLEVMNPRSNINWALNVNPATGIYQDAQRIYARNLEVPSGNGVGTARAIAHAYSIFATGGRELGLRKETLDMLADPAIPPTHGFYDECLIKGRGAVFSGLHEAERGLAVRQRYFVRLAGVRRVSWLCRSDRRRRLRLCNESPWSSGTCMVTITDSARPTNITSSASS
jgi:hypothetical protein